MSKSLITIILGPTASGKTDYAIALAKEKNGAVISADSRQVYAGMDVGTAKPPFDGGNLKSQISNSKQIPNSKSQIQKRTGAHDALQLDMVGGIPHYLFNIREPNDPLTLADWQEAAYSVIKKILQDGQHPIIAGGTMLYIDSLLFHYDIPSVGPNAELREQLEELSAEELYTKLREQDPDALQFIEPKNKRRIIRALEVMEGTGKKFSVLRRKREPLYDFDVIGLFSDWDTLRDHITKRAQQMLDEGLLEETQALREIYGPTLPLLRTMNYKEAGQVLDQITPLRPAVAQPSPGLWPASKAMAGKQGSAGQAKEKALDLMVSANVRYARRQMSWWRGRSDIIWKSPQPL